MFFGRKKSTPTLFHAFLVWLPLAAGLTVVLVAVYAAVQHNFRQSANDPQIQIAEDAAGQITDGVDPLTLVPATQVNLATSLAPFVIVFDSTNRVLASNAVLDGKTPVPPAGVLAAARQAGQNRVTWQPRPGVRMATVSIGVKDHQGEVVMAGRSLREIEVRENQDQQDTGQQRQCEIHETMESAI